MKRFWDKVQITANIQKCWLWKSNTSEKGYGKFSLNGKPKRAHRVAYELFYGPFDNTLNVLHRCDNRKCVNPYHLFLGTQRDNIQDMIKKSRGKDQVHLDTVNKILALYKTGNYTQKELGEMFNVTQSCISRFIVKGK